MQKYQDHILHQSGEEESADSPKLKTTKARQSTRGEGSHMSSAKSTANKMKAMEVTKSFKKLSHETRAHDDEKNNDEGNNEETLDH